MSSIIREQDQGIDPNNFECVKLILDHVAIALSPDGKLFMLDSQMGSYDPLGDAQEALQRIIQAAQHLQTHLVKVPAGVHVH